MRVHRLLSPLLLVLASGVAASDVAAQGSSYAVREGRRVRVAPNPVSPGERWLVGTIHRVGADTLWLRVPDFVEPVWVLRSDVRRVQVSRGFRDRFTYLIGGAAAGGAVGAMGGSLLGGGGTCMVCPPPELALAVPGMFFGALIGASYGGEDWARAVLADPPPDGDVAVSPVLRLPAGGGTSVGVSLRF